MNILAMVLFIVLATIAALHFYWAVGGLWPGKDEASLAKTVIGAKGIKKMPPQALTLFVSGAILVASLWPLMWRAVIPYALPQLLLWLGMLLLTFVFIGRGIAGYLPFFQRTNCEQPFARLDRHYFSPLCLLIGAGFAVLLFRM
jgi:hypothetical protein